MVERIDSYIWACCLMVGTRGLRMTSLDSRMQKTVGWDKKGSDGRKMGTRARYGKSTGTVAVALAEAVKRWWCGQMAPKPPFSIIVLRPCSDFSG